MRMVAGGGVAFIILLILARTLFLNITWSQTVALMLPFSSSTCIPIRLHRYTYYVLYVDTRTLRASVR